MAREVFSLHQIAVFRISESCSTANFSFSRSPIKSRYSGSVLLGGIPHVCHTWTQGNPFGTFPKSLPYWSNASSVDFGFSPSHIHLSGAKSLPVDTRKCHCGPTTLHASSTIATQLALTTRSIPSCFRSTRYMLGLFCLLSDLGCQLFNQVLFHFPPLLENLFGYFLFLSTQ